MKNIGGFNQFSAAASLTLSQHFLEKKKKKNCPFILFNKATLGIKQNDTKVNKYKIKTKKGWKRENP